MLRVDAAAATPCLFAAADADMPFSAAHAICYAMMRDASAMPCRAYAAARAMFAVASLPLLIAAADALRVC